MIYVFREVAVNRDPASTHPKLSRGEIWRGLVMKAENALPFVPGLAKCDVVQRSPGSLVRDIVFRGEEAREKVTFYPEEKVVFVRQSGSIDGFIVNEILGEDGDLRLRFSFALQLLDAPSGSAREREFREVVEREYVKAVDATLDAIRKMVSSEHQSAR
ncbi:SRPBCC family protein [Sorangium sp. So ce726]|uniref:SRPBCC family protein n=1 Tax=Sorangium sp. So ce726 TaxID=3133319 RepID=UPI003F5FB20C